MQLLNRVVAQKLIGGIMSDHLENYKKLTSKQQSLVKHYTNESNRNTYLNRVESYRSAGYCKGGQDHTVRNAAYRMFNMPSILAAIKELAPKSFNTFFVRDEMLDTYNEAKKEGKLELRHKILVDMYKAEGGFADKKKDEDSVDSKEVAEVQKLAQNLWLTRSAAMAEKTAKKA